MSTTTSTPMQCRHVFTDGHRCLGHCLRHENFCYFHHTARRPIENPAARRRRGTTFTLPELEDRASIQLALSEILQRIAANDLDPKRAGHLLYGLQIATSLLPKLDPKHQPKSVSEITHDEELGDLAPIAEVGHDREPEPWELEIAKIMESIKPQAPELEPTVDAIEPEVETVPIIQAVADTTGESVGAPCLNSERWVEAAQLQATKRSTQINAYLLEGMMERVAVLSAEQKDHAPGHAHIVLDIGPAVRQLGTQVIRLCQT